MQARAAKRLANKEKAEEEKARKEDNVQKTKELLRISDENMVWIFLTIIYTCLVNSEKLLRLHKVHKDILTVYR